MGRPRRLPHPAYLVLLAITVAYGSLAMWKRANRPAGRWVGYAECSWRGKPRFVVRSGLKRVDSIGVVAHESVHVAQCDRLGPVRYRWNTIFAASNLALETPAYCASGRARLRLTGDTILERNAVPHDMLAAMGDVVDSITILRALKASCPEFLTPSLPR